MAYATETDGLGRRSALDGLMEGVMFLNNRRFTNYLNGLRTWSPVSMEAAAMVTQKRGKRRIEVLWSARNSSGDLWGLNIRYAQFPVLEEDSVDERMLLRPDDTNRTLVTLDDQLQLVHRALPAIPVNVVMMGRDNTPVNMMDFAHAVDEARASGVAPFFQTQMPDVQA